MSARIRITKNIFLLSTVFSVLTGCALSSPSPVDISSPPDQEYTEFDALVDVPISTAYQNILSNAPACWCNAFSGEILAHAADGASGRISFVVPGKFLGSRIELATVRLLAHNAHQTRIVGTSSFEPGSWHLSGLAGWAQSASSSCSAAQPPSS